MYSFLVLIYVNNGAHGVQLSSLDGHLQDPSLPSLPAAVYKLSWQGGGL